MSTPGDSTSVDPSRREKLAHALVAASGLVAGVFAGVVIGILTGLIPFRC